MRIQGGTSGLLAAIEAGKIDPLDPDADRGPRHCLYRAEDWRLINHDHRRRDPWRDRRARMA